MSKEKKKQAQRIAETVKDACEYQKAVIVAFAEGLVQGMGIAERRNKFIGEAEKTGKKEEKKESE